MDRLEATPRQARFRLFGPYCGCCGCAMVGELKKGRCVYYHCTGYKGKCAEPYEHEADLPGNPSFSRRAFERSAD